MRWYTKSEKFSIKDFQRALQLFSKRDKTLIILISFVQIALAFLDLIAVAAVGALGALSILSLEATNPGERVSLFLSWLRIEEFSLQIQFLALATITTICFITKTFFSIIVNRKLLFFLSNRSNHMTRELTSKVFSQNIETISKYNPQQLTYLLSDGTKNLFLGMIGSIILIYADTFILFVLICGLVLLDSFSALFIVTSFIVTTFILNKYLQKRSRQYGEMIYDLTVESNTNLLNLLNGYREIFVRGSKNFYLNTFYHIKKELGVTIAELNFQPFIPKYVIETLTILGVFSLGIFQFLTKSPSQAFSLLAVYLAASSRIMPAILRIQQNMLVLSKSSGSSKGTLALIDETGHLKMRKTEFEVAISHDLFVPEVKINNLFFKYKDRDDWAIENLSLKIPAGMKIALVGESGSGKTTLIELILGLNEPEKGSILVSGFHPSLALNKWSGSISYVPQNISFVSGTIADNISMGITFGSDDTNRMWEVLRIANLSNFVSSLPQTLETRIDSSGLNMSGGQRQRLGLARALFTEPKLLILDEATSALDGETEEAINLAIRSLGKDLTVVTVAHRLSTIKKSDQIIFLEKGQIISQGTLKEVRNDIQKFNNQIKLMEL